MDGNGDTVAVAFWFWEYGEDVDMSGREDGRENEFEYRELLKIVIDIQYIIAPADWAGEEGSNKGEHGG